VNSAIIGLTATAAALGLMGALALERGNLPHVESLATALHAVALSAAAGSAYLLLVRARSLDDGRLRWIGAALAVTAFGLLLHLVGTASIAAQDGGSADAASARGFLYLTWHLAIAASVVGAITWPRAGRAPRIALVALAVCALAVGGAFPHALPVLVRSDGSFTSTFRGSLAIVAIVSLGVTVSWAAHAGRRSS